MKNLIRADCHLHTNASPDSNADMEDMIKQAINLELDEICITDHVDFPLFEDISNWEGFSFSDPAMSSGETISDWVRPMEDGKTCEVVRIPFEDYIANYIRLASVYEDKLKVRMGCEIGLSYHCSDAIHSTAARFPYDFIIGSLHSADCYDICGNSRTLFCGKSKREVYAAHLNEMIQNVLSYDCFDVLGHIDYIIRYCPYEDRCMHVHEFDDLLSDLFKFLIEKGKGIELNTSGFRYNLGHAHPHIDILRKYRGAGGEIITVGSDAHKPRDVGRFLAEASEILLEAGFKRYCKFNKRSPVFIEL